jgi:hypothetical protein
MWADLAQDHRDDTRALSVSSPRTWRQPNGVAGGPWWLSRVALPGGSFSDRMDKIECRGGLRIPARDFARAVKPRTRKSRRTTVRAN